MRKSRVLLPARKEDGRRPACVRTRPAEETVRSGSRRRERFAPPSPFPGPCPRTAPLLDAGIWRGVPVDGLNGQDDVFLPNIGNSRWSIHCAGCGWRGLTTNTACRFHLASPAITPNRGLFVQSARRFTNRLASRSRAVYRRTRSGKRRGSLLRGATPQGIPEPRARR